MQEENHEILTALQYKPQWKKGKKYKTRGYNGTRSVNYQRKQYVLGIKRKLLNSQKQLLCK